jgi:hypothetical protein
MIADTHGPANNPIFREDGQGNSGSNVGFSSPTALIPQSSELIRQALFSESFWNPQSPARVHNIRRYPKLEAAHRDLSSTGLDLCRDL